MCHKQYHFWRIFKIVRWFAISKWSYLHHILIEGTFKFTMKRLFFSPYQTNMYPAALQNNICMSENLCSATVLHYKAVLSHKCCLYNLDIWPCSKCLTLITSVAQGFIPCASASPFQSLLQPRAWRILMPRVNRSTWSNTSTCALAGKNLIEISMWNPTNECLSSSERLRSGLSLSPSCSGSLP